MKSISGPLFSLPLSPQVDPCSLHPCAEPESGVPGISEGSKVVGLSVLNRDLFSNDGTDRA